MKNPHRQVELQNKQTKIVGWLPESKALRVGTVCSLPEDSQKRWWRITWVGAALTDKSKLNRSWNNNI